MTWQECVRESAKNNPDLIAAVEGINQSRAGERITKSSLFPQINSSLSAGTSKSSGSPAEESYSYGLTGSQLVFDGTKTLSDVRAASENTRAARENYRFVSSDVRFRLRSAFIDLLRAQEMIQVTEEIAKIRKDNLVLIALRYQSGLEHKGALLNAEANLQQAKFQVDRAKRNIEVAQRQLTKEMGRPNFVSLEVKGELEAGELAKEKPDFEKLAKNNPSLQKIIALKNAAAFGVKAAKQSFYPVVSAEAGAGRTSERWPPERDEWNLGMGVSLPLFEGGLKFAQVSQAQASLNQTKANERSTKDSAVVALEETWAQWQNAIDFVQVEKKYLSAAEERARISQAQYSIGMISYDNWTIIEDELVRAKLALLDAQAAALIAEASWIQAKGETLEYEKS